MLTGIAIALIVVMLTGIVILGLPATKGWAGERCVRVVLNRLPKERFTVMNDVRFYGKEKENAGRGRHKGKRWSCQIDHLVISPYGIFCIETKNYLGVIAGNYKDKFLQRRVLGMRYKTYSPIHQNYRHLQRLVEAFPLIKAHSNDLHSIVCFMPGANLRIKDSGAAIICKIKDLKKEILKFDEPVMDIEVCKTIVKEIKYRCRV